MFKVFYRSPILDRSICLLASGLLLHVTSRICYFVPTKNKSNSTRDVEEEAAPRQKADVAVSGPDHTPELPCHLSCLAFLAVKFDLKRFLPGPNPRRQHLLPAEPPLPPRRGSSWFSWASLSSFSDPPQRELLPRRGPRPPPRPPARSSSCWHRHPLAFFV